MTARILRRALAGLIAVTPASAADPTLRSDMDLVHAARAALAADPETARVHLLVSVVDGGLVAGGPVPSDETAARVSVVLRNVPGVRHVAVNCWVPAAAADPLKTAVRDKLLRPDPLPDRLAAARTTANRYVPPVGPLLLEPVVPRPAGYSPLPPPAPPPPPGLPPYPTIRPPAVPVVPAQDVAAAVAEVRRTDPAFAGLSATVTGGTVVVSGRPADPAELWRLAAAVRRVPGVDRVVVRPTE